MTRICMRVIGFFWGNRPPHFIAWRDLVGIGEVGKDGMFALRCTDERGQPCSRDVPECARGPGGETPHATLVAALAGYCAGLPAASLSTVGTFVATVVRTKPPIRRTVFGAVLAIAAVGFAAWLLLEKPADRREWRTIYYAAVVSALFAFFFLRGVFKGWRAQGQQISWPAVDIRPEGFVTKALPDPAGNDNGDLEEEGHNVTWQQVRNIEPPIADEDSFAVDVGWRQPLRLPTSARSEDGRTLYPALLEAWQAWRDSAELRDGPGPA